MFTLRNLAGLGLLIFGSTYLWLTPALASPGIDTSGWWWAATTVLSLMTVAGFAAASLALVVNRASWAPLAVASGALGVIVLFPYWVAASRSDETSPEFNVALHLLGAAGVFALVLIADLEH